MLEPEKIYLNKISKSKYAVKYLLYFIISILLVLFFAQLFAQLFTVNQLNKVTGKIIAQHERSTSYTAGTRRSGGSPNYSLILTLDNNQTYYIDLDDSNWGVQNTRYEGNIATIYTPTPLYNILSLDCLNYNNGVSQCEINGVMLYSFKHRKQNNMQFMLYLAIVTIPFGYILFRWYKAN